MPQRCIAHTTRRYRQIYWAQFQVGLSRPRVSRHVTHTRPTSMLSVLRLVMYIHASKRQQTGKRDDRGNEVRQVESESTCGHVVHPMTNKNDAYATSCDRSVYVKVSRHVT
jgi:hypothetical protein